jgi:hypothetical protein
MSTAAKTTLAASVLFCCASIVGVHYMQTEERTVSWNKWLIYPIPLLTCVPFLRTYEQVSCVTMNEEKRRNNKRSI